MNQIQTSFPLLSLVHILATTCRRAGRPDILLPVWTSHYTVAQ